MPHWPALARLCLKITTAKLIIHDRNLWITNKSSRVKWLAFMFTIVSPWGSQLTSSLFSMHQFKRHLRNRDVHRSDNTGSIMTRQVKVIQSASQRNWTLVGMLSCEWTIWISGIKLKSETSWLQKPSRAQNCKTKFFLISYMQKELFSRHDLVAWSASKTTLL